MFPPRPGIDLEAHAPYEGDFMIGLKAFGCASSTLHCKEYLQIRLKEPLVPGVSYDFEYHLSPTENSVRVNGFGVAVSDTLIQSFMLPGFLPIQPAVVSEEIVDVHPGDWHRVEGSFVATGQEQYLILGNFLEDESIKAIFPEGSLKYGFYMLDNVGLYPQDGHTRPIITLENVVFEFDKAILLPAAFPILEQVAKQLVAAPDRSAVVVGHTDNIGSDDYNQHLSQERADAVKQFLIQKGVAPYQVKAIGRGDAFPLVKNDTSENREKNRRVEIEIRPKRGD